MTDGYLTSAGDRGHPRLLDAVLDQIEVLRHRERSVAELTGGLTNRNFKVSTSDRCYVVRVSSQQSADLSIDREHEYHNSLIAASSGVGAPVVDNLPELGVMVLGFLEGHTFTEESFSVPGNLVRVAAACRLLHSGPRFVNDFDMFAIQRRYLRVVRERGYRLPAGYLDFTADVDRVRDALAATSEPTVPCNNDLLPGNLIDGGDHLYLIDYEYSGNNDPCFELGNIWSECHLSVDQLEVLIDAYFGRSLRNKMARAQLQALMSQYGWTLWAAIQDATSTLDFDFWGWGIEKYERAVETFRSPLLNRLIEELQRTE